KGPNPPGANARGKNEAFPLLRPALADQYRSPRGCLRTMRVRIRGYSSAPTFPPTRIAQDRCCIGVPSGYLPAMHLLLCAHRSHGLLENLIAVVWMHGRVAIA